MRPYTQGRRRAAARLGADRAHARDAGRRAALGAAPHRAPTSHALGALTGNQAVQRCAPASRPSTSPAGRSRPTRTPPGQMYPDQSLYPVDSVPKVVRRINHALQRADQIEHAEGKARAPLVRADRRRRRGRLRRPAQRLRADEGDDRGGRRGRPLRGPAREREEVRPHGRQGARADERSSSARSSPRASPPTCCDVPTVLVARTDADSAKLLTSDIDERDRPFIAERRAHGRGLLPAQERRRHGHRARPRLRALRRPDLVRDVARPTSRRRRSSPRASTRSSRASCSRTTARRRSTGRRTSTTRPSPSSSASSARWATSSSSSPWPASTRSTSRCSSSRASYKDRGMAAYSRAAAGRVRRRERTATPPRATSARSAPATSTRSPRSSRGGKASTLALEDSTEEHQF